jgi:hypothetical protein
MRILASEAVSVPFASGLVCRQVSAQPAPFPEGFKTRDIARNWAFGPRRVARKGPAVVTTHGFGATSDIWSPLSALLARDYTGGLDRARSRKWRSRFWRLGPSTSNPRCTRSPKSATEPFTIYTTALAPIDTVYVESVADPHP